MSASITERRAAASRSSRRASSGFTLVELAVAMTFMLVAVLGTVSSQVASHKLMETARETNIAMADLQNAMERILLIPREQIPVAGGHYPPGAAIPAFDDLHLAGERIVPTYPNFVPGAPLPDLLFINIEIDWNTFDGHQRSISITCAKSQ